MQFFEDFLVKNVEFAIFRDVDAAPNQKLRNFRGSGIAHGRALPWLKFIAREIISGREIFFK